MVPMSTALPLRPARSATPATIASRWTAPAHALALAAEGRTVAVVSGGDPGVFAMAAAVFEAIEAGDPAWRALDVTVVPGVTAMHAAAARLGAPLGHDFCAISLSDNLKPWAVIARRLAAAADGDFVHRALQSGLEGAARPDPRGLRRAAHAQARGYAGGLRPRRGPAGRAHHCSRLWAQPIPASPT